VIEEGERLGVAGRGEGTLDPDLRVVDGAQPDVKR
jgi:hypothetical protein